MTREKQLELFYNGYLEAVTALNKAADKIDPKNNNKNAFAESLMHIRTNLNKSVSAELMRLGYKVGLSGKLEQNS